MRTKPDIAAYELFVELRAARNGKSEAEIEGEISPAQFKELLQGFHQRYMSGEFTLGKLADLLEVPTLNLIDILDGMKLPVRYN